MMSRIFSILTLLLLTSITLYGQELIDTAWLGEFEPRSIGPAGMSGRVTAIEVDPREKDRIYVGTASGGLWLSKNGGTSWNPIFDDAPVQSVGAIALHPGNPDIIYVGTGEGNPRNSHNSGAGMFKSIDGGLSWKYIGLEETRLIHRIKIDPQHPNTLYVAAMGSAWGPNPERGVYKSEDGGMSWEKVLFINETTAAADLVMDPLNPNKLIAAMWDYERKPWTFRSGGPGSGIYMTVDGGDNWKKIEDDDLPEGELGRIGLAIAPSKPERVYALVEAKTNALYRSDNGGRNWEKVSERNIGNRPFYYAEIYVDPKNENRIFNLYSYLSKSEDAGKSFEVIAGYSRGNVHPDHHAFWIDPEDPDYIIEGNDGGLNISRDGGHTWRFVSNLPLAQFYHINYDMETPYNVYGGMQDNGSWVGPSEVWHSGGIVNSDWQEVYFGDGFDVVPVPGAPRFVYAMSQGGNLGFVDTETGDTRFIKPVHPKGEFLRFNWNAAIAQDPFHPCGVYFGSQYLHYSRDCGINWKIISPDLTTDDPEKQKQAESGGLTIDATQAENYTTILAVAPSPLDSSVIWVGTDDGRLHISRNAGDSWESLESKLPDFPAGAWIPQIVASPHAAGEVFVVVNDYRRNNWQPFLYHGSNYGNSWRRIMGPNDADAHVQSVVQDQANPDLLFAGTDRGLYFSLDKGINWAKWHPDFPPVSIRDLKIHPRENDLIIGTFGRAAYILDDISPLRSIKEVSVQDSFKLFDAADEHLAEYRSYQGIRFTGGAEWSGENDPSGVLLTLWIKPDETTEKQKESKVSFVVYNSDRDTVRTFTRELEPGFKRMVWNARMNTPDYPSRRERQADADPPARRTAPPGTYHIVATSGKSTDTVIVELLSDPRLAASELQLKRKEEMLDEFFQLVEQASSMFDRMKKMQETIKLVNNTMENEADSVQDLIESRGDSISGILDSLMNEFMTPENFVGYDHVTPRINRELRNLHSYINGSKGNASNTVEAQWEYVSGWLDKIKGSLNELTENLWADYRRIYDDNRPDIFPKITPFE